ncbi:MAG: hypothetical protein K9G60_03815, partial [Pseudolabrys sp.]|nr:hypothetical protein [Pseudolabrys sp.]
MEFLKTRGKANHDGIAVDYVGFSVHCQRPAAACARKHEFFVIAAAFSRFRSLCCPFEAGAARKAQKQTAGLGARPFALD